MATSKPEEPPSPSQSHYYKPLPPQSPDQDYVVLPYYHRRLRRPSCRILCIASLVLFLAALVYTLWPSDPEVKIVRMHINRMQLHTIPIISLDISLFVTLKVKNSDVYSLDFTTLDVAVGYRGKMLGHVTAEQGHVRALGSSYVEAELELNGIEVLSDVVYMLEDLAKGTIPFDTVTEVVGCLGLSFLKFPLKVSW
ncbi:Late embryogenesis abundant protein, LEA-14 [Corchorus capsularis]|uniref:Late embryogenesis abundant protein, LEA-14 n=1 Tax=Corchorus capsularis TaxID=210143 RepID=A0A1R3G7Q4_COCAP|nr:Late embryogenesis abundant protein, LEA-14 [Corchorus capsularis]